MKIKKIAVPPKKRIGSVKEEKRNKNKISETPPSKFKLKSDLKNVSKKKDIKYQAKDDILLNTISKMKNILQNKPGPIINTKANESLNKKLEEIEANKAKNLQQYREMIMKMKKEKRHQEEIEGKDSLFIGEDEKEKGKGKEQPKETAEEIEKRKRNMSLAEKLKAKLKKNQ